MDYSPCGGKDLDMTECLTLSLRKQKNAEMKDCLSSKRSNNGKDQS